jgi:hypothetical protein
MSQLDISCDNAAAHQEQVVGIAEALDGLHQHRQFLFSREAARVNHQARRIRQAETRTQSMVASGWRIDCGVHPKRLPTHAMDAKLVQPVDHDLAWRQHKVEATIKVRHVAGRDRSGRAAETLPDQ